MVKGISILGSTGSIGRQTLEVISSFPSRFKVLAIAAKDELELIEEQIKKFQPKIVSVENEEIASKLIARLGKTTTTVYFGEEGLLKVGTYEGVSLLVVAIPGITALLPTLEAIKLKKDIALATKEILVSAGDLVMAEIEKSKSKIFPIDSEHSAIAQCLGEEEMSKVKRVILTASGGPFLNMPLGNLSKVTPKEALEHPVWKMGPKISIDSATLMNKGFEVIEAHHLFKLDYSQIDVVIHPQSIIHSMVEFVDGSVIAQTSAPDMRIPIQYALLGEERLPNIWGRLDFAKISSLTFNKVEAERFPCLSLAYEAGKRGGTLPAVLNAANEEATAAFLRGKIKFTDIAKIIEDAIKKHKVIESPSLNDILKADSGTRESLTII